MAFKHILVALDRAAEAIQVFEIAVEQARQTGATLLFMHCVRRESDIQSAPFMGIGTIADIDTYGTLKRIQQEHLLQELQLAQMRLQDWCQKAALRGVSAELDCPIGEPSLEICNVARNWGADLIIIGRRGHQGLSEIVLGSVSNYVVHHAPCSVLVVQGSATPSNPDAADSDRDKVEV